MQIQIQTKSKPNQVHMNIINQNKNKTPQKKLTMIQTNRNKFTRTSRRSFGLKDFYKECNHL
jgi:hypothetical protein